MPRYIDIDKFIAEHTLEADVNAKYRALIRELEEFPTEEFEIEPQSLWFLDRNDNFRCGNCRNITLCPDDKYCSNCGAKMDANPWRKVE